MKQNVLLSLVLSALLLTGCAGAGALPAPSGAGDAAAVDAAAKAAGAAIPVVGWSVLVADNLNRAADGLAGSSLPEIEAGPFISSIGDTYQMIQTPVGEEWSLNGPALMAAGTTVVEKTTEFEYGTVSVRATHRCIDGNNAQIFFRITYTHKSGMYYTNEAGKTVKDCDPAKIKGLATELRKHLEGPISNALRDAARRMGERGRAIDEPAIKMTGALRKIVGQAITALKALE